MSRTAPSNSDDVIDSRDVIERIAELEALIDTDENDEPTDAGIPADGEIATEEERAELAALKALQEEAEGYASDWQYGVTLIRDDHFETYARQLAEDMGLMNNDYQWPYTCIDWGNAAEELQQDYTSVDFDGVTYWVR